MSATYILISIPGLLLQVFLAVPSVVDHQLTCTKCCQKCEKKLMSTSITTAYHILDEEKPNWSDTSWFWRPPWSSPPGCPCHPQCRWPPTFMSLMLSNMLKIYNHYHPSISHPSWRKNSYSCDTFWFQQLHGILLQVVLAVHSVVDNQLTCP